MFILPRRLNQRVYIGDEITFTVVGVQAGVVRIGIEAPKEVPVHREEIYLRIQQDQKEAQSKDDESD